MKNISIYYIALCCLILFSGTVGRDDTPSGYELTKTMFKTTKSISTMEFTMGKLERINGKMVDQTSDVKLRRNPLAVYSKQTDPPTGIEVLYKEGEPKALVNPNGFPWVNVNLDPYGSTMRKNQHHTIHDAGYDLVVSILEHLFEKYGEECREMSSITGKEQLDGNTCYVIDIKNPYFKFEDYTVKEGENLISIAAENKLSEFMILENNPSVKDYYDVKKGQVIKVPNDYSPHFILYLDQKRMIPLMMKIYDDKGLYEQYKYTNVSLNVEFEEAEFTPDFDAYGF